MSKVKTPQQKKELSYELDRRNVYGENHKSSTKNIRRAKQRSHMVERRTATQVLASLDGSADPRQLETTQAEINDRQLEKKLKRFKKSPDKPLGEVVAEKLKNRAVKNRPA